MRVSCVALFSPASGLCAVSGGVAFFGLGRTLAGLGLGGLLPTAISMVSDYAPRARAALTTGLLMTAHHAGGILSAYVALWIVEPLGWRAAFWVCVVPLLFVPVLARFLPESPSFLVARDRVEEARAPAARYDAELPAAKDRTAAGAPGPTCSTCSAAASGSRPCCTGRPPPAACSSSTASPPGCPP
ncbi:MFS transporter [Streptomyces sp. NPDC057236]|uniref:MFS transporter n=1 Tax=Streptomyces sp. NPDC057236 TaxID=3346059 RepID=UPI003644B215